MPVTNSHSAFRLNLDFMQRIDTAPLATIYVGLGTKKLMPDGTYYPPNPSGSYQEVVDAWDSIAQVGYQRLAFSCVSGSNDWKQATPASNYVIKNSSSVSFGPANTSWGSVDNPVRYILFFSTQTPTIGDLLFWGDLASTTANVTTNRNLIVPAGNIEIYYKNIYV